MLTEKEIRNIKEQKLIFTTADKNGQPRSIWVLPSRVLKDKIIISNIQMNRTIQNVRENNKVFINVYMEEQDDLQYKIEGMANIYETGELFDEIKTFEETENLPSELKVNSIIVVEITNFEQSNG